MGVVALHTKNRHWLAVDIQPACILIVVALGTHVGGAQVQPLHVGIMAAGTVLSGFMGKGQTQFFLDAIMATKAQPRKPFAEGIAAMSKMRQVTVKAGVVIDGAMQLSLAQVHPEITMTLEAQSGHRLVKQRGGFRKMTAMTVFTGRKTIGGKNLHTQSPGVFFQVALLAYQGCGHMQIRRE